MQKLEAMNILQEAFREGELPWSEKDQRTLNLLLRTAGLPVTALPTRGASERKSDGDDAAITEAEATETTKQRSQLQQQFAKEKELMQQEAERAVLETGEFVCMKWGGGSPYLLMAGAKIEEIRERMQSLRSQIAERTVSRKKEVRCNK